ncbi:MAG: acylphosphatase [Burkholderiaceae bacterium]|nr:acylphosphatase [Burkholderiaceae bacterium]
MLQRRLTIHGLVQGVGFRAALAREARRRGLAGWVRNRSDGTVEAVVAGDPAAVDEMTRWAARGPPAARVTRVDAEPASGEFDGFEMRPTA